MEENNMDQRLIDLAHKHNITQLCMMFGMMTDERFGQRLPTSFGIGLYPVIADRIAAAAGRGEDVIGMLRRETRVYASAMCN